MASDTNNDMKATSGDAGCWIDGAAGHEEVRTRLARLIDTIGVQPECAPECAQGDHRVGCPIADCYSALRATMSDDAAEEDQAIDLLNAHLAPDGYAFGFHEGDVFLLSVEDWES